MALASSSSSSSSCIYCDSGSKHPLWVYLLSDERCSNNLSEHRIVPYVGKCSNPYLRLCAQNRLGRKYGSGNQLTKSGDGRYQIEMVFGPMWSGASAFKSTVRKESRKISKRILRFADYAKQLLRQPGNKGKLYVRSKKLVNRLYNMREANRRKDRV